MSDYDDLTRPNKRKSKLPSNSKNLLQQTDNSVLDIDQFKKEITDGIVKSQRDKAKIKGGYNGSIKKLGRASINDVKFVDNVQWTPAKKVLTFLITGGSYAAFIITIYLIGAKALAIIFGAVTMSLFLIFYIIYWVTKG